MYASSSSSFLRRRALAALLATTALTLAAQQAGAQEVHVAPPTPTAQPSASETIAEQAFNSYESGAYAESISLYLKAYDLSKDVRILFNVAQIYDKKLQDRDLALSFYRRYLKTETQEPELSKRAIERIAALSSNDRITPVAGASTEAPSKTLQPQPQTASRSPYWIGWIATGALAAGAVTCGIVALSASNDLEQASFAGAAPPDVTDARSRVKTFALATDIFASTAIVTAGVMLYFTLTGSARAHALVERNLWLAGSF